MRPDSHDGLNAMGTAAVPNDLGGIRLKPAGNRSGANILNIDILESLVAYNNCSGCSGGIVVGL